MVAHLEAQRARALAGHEAVEQRLVRVRVRLRVRLRLRVRVRVSWALLGLARGQRQAWLARDAGGGWVVL